MTLTRSETDSAMLSNASKSDNQSTDYTSQITLNRGTESTHPRDCICAICIRMKYLASTIIENEIKEGLGYFKGTANE